MKIPNLFPKKKKLRAATRAVPRRILEESEEPSMRLSSAFVVVLLLHLVAVGGIYAFNSIKTHQGSSANPPSVAATPAPAVPQAGDTKTDSAGASSGAANKTATKPVEHKPVEPAVKPGVQDSGQIYTVAKGDNPVTIAKRLRVSYDELLKLNKIEDPKKLQIGQKLRIPPRIKTN